MRVTGFFSAVGAVILGIIIADFLIHPEGTTAVGNAIVNIEKPAVNALLGKTT